MRANTELSFGTVTVKAKKLIIFFGEVITL
jgi:hypothetical protein